MRTAQNAHSDYATHGFLWDTITLVFFTAITVKKQPTPITYARSNSENLKTLAFYNIKGGVGKTTSAVKIAYLAAQAELRTILWDLDAQSCASWYLGVDDQTDHKIMRVFKGKTPLGKLRISSAYPKLEVIPADLGLRKLELLLDRADNRKVLQNLADHLSENSRLLMFDCSPSYNRLSEAIFTCSDILVVPLVPSPLSLRAFEQLRDLLTSKKAWRHLELFPFFTMVDRRRIVHNDFLLQAKKLIGDANPVVIPYASDLERMGIHRQPIARFAASSPAAAAYQDMWQRLLKRYQLN